MIDETLAHAAADNRTAEAADGQPSAMVLTADQQHLVTEVFNATWVEYPQHRTVHELFAEQVRRTADAIAVVHGQQSLTYVELDVRSSQLAQHLQARGVGPGEIVGICVERSLDLVVGVLAILKAGAAYLPLDPNYPRERLQHMLTDAAPRLVLTQESLLAALPETHAELIALDEAPPRSMPVSSGEAAVAREPTPTDLVYVIYTSGSTGRPKGTAMPHRAMVNLIEWQRRALPCKVPLRTLQFAALSFDVAFQEIFSTLCSGGSLILLDEWVRKDPRALLALLNRERITRLFLPPLMLHGLAEQHRSTGTVPLVLEDVIVAGEQLRITPQIVELFKGMGTCRLHNHYGPTESHVVTALTLPPEPNDWPVLPTIGRPIANTQIYILDSQRRPVAPGTAGEIYIGGRNVARGYLNRPELTAERFILDSFSRDPLARLYRTGDLGQWRADGTIEYLGRSDDQVKIRGFRIEPGEIEARLAVHPRVHEAAVVARGHVPGESYLVAYVTQREATPPNADELRAHLKTTLPDHMVPAAFVVLDRLPLTPSGKLNRRALPAPDPRAIATQPYEVPHGEIEQLLAEIWRELLHVDRVGRHDNFFELGGHSLLIAQMMERLRQIGLDVELRRVFSKPTLADVAAACKAVTPEQLAMAPNLIPDGSESITPTMLPLLEMEDIHIEQIVRRVPGGARNVQDIYPLAPLQEGILFHHVLNDRSSATYVLPTLLSLCSRRRLDELIAALQAVIDRHDVLRTAVLWEHLPQPVQVVYRHATLPVEEVVLDAERDALAQVHGWMRADDQRLDLTHAPLMRLRVARDPQTDEWYALLQLHHIAVDHVAFDIVIAETVEILEGRGRSLPKSAPYRNHVAQVLAYSRAHDSEEFFRGKLGDADEPTAPFGLLDVRGDGSQVAQAHKEVAATLGQGIRVQARRLGVSPAALFHAGWGLVVAHTSGRDDVVFGSLLLGRLQGSASTQPILGMFINTLPLRLRLGELGAEDLVQQTQRELVDLVMHEHASLAAAQRCSALEGSVPLFTSLLNYVHGAANPEAQWSKARGVRALAFHELTNYPITLLVHDSGESFLLTGQTDRQIDPAKIVDYLATAMQSLVLALESAPRTAALMLSVLPEDERDRILHTFNSGPADSAGYAVISRMFEEQVERTPQAVAVTYEGDTLTYGQLNGRANQLARHLIDKGVEPDHLVGICVEPGFDMVVGLLGILKAGGAYVPLDPHYPADRLLYMLEDAAPRVVLTHRNARSALPPTAAELVMLDEDWDAITPRDSANLSDRIAPVVPSHLAYVIYTSGSTGKPKGVMVEHRNVTRLLAATAPWFSFDQRDVWTLFHSFAFDFSVWELWGALLYGGRVVVVPHDLARSPRAFFRLLCEQGVTVLNQTPSAFSQLIDAQACSPAERHSLRLVIFGGEALELHALRPWVMRNGVDRPQLVNMYGITETTVHVTYRPLKAAEIASAHGSPIGVPIPDLRLYVLDPRMQPVPVGVVGEMYVGGAGVARGYLNRPELTAQRFLADPFGCAGRIYKSGDLARWRADGTLEYLGRNDDQVKIRGHRIELGEIAAQLASHEQVKEVAVIARHDDPGEKRLVAYIVPKDRSATPSVTALREHLNSSLPEYMVPKAFVTIERMPLTANGKLNRRALPAPESTAFSSRQYQPPNGEAELALAQIWRDLLHVDRVGRDDNFFDLGGHSLLAMQVMARVHAALAIEMPISMVFGASTLQELAAKVDALRRERLAATLAEGGSEVQELIEKLVSMPESAAQELLREMTREARS